MRVFSVIIVMLLAAASVHAVDNRVFRIDMDMGWVERNASQDNEKYFFSYVNHDSLAFVAYQVSKKKDKSYTDLLSSELIDEAKREVSARGDEIQESARYKHKGCTVDYLAYYKLGFKATNVDFYMYCGGKLVTANYALRGMDSGNINRAKKLHKSFKLK